jgi:hypothetical protein
VSAKLEDRMQAKVDTAKRRLAGDAPETESGGEPSETEAPSPDELRQVFRKFRRLMGTAGNPETVDIEGALRTGWIISSGTVEGYGDEEFHVVMLTNGALHYFSGPVDDGPIELTAKWFLGDSIPALEAKMPDRLAELLAKSGIDWDEPAQA